MLHPMAVTEAVTVDVWVRAGGRNEPDPWLGISHFLEHMVFKGTETLKPGVLDAAIEGRGGVVNAATGQDYTHFYITVASQDVADTLPYLAEVVAHAAIPEQEFERERRVVLEEIRRASDSPDYTAYHGMLAQAYPHHPYGRPVLGTMESLYNITPDILRQYHRSWYQPEHMTVVVVGHFDLDATLALIKRYFGFKPAVPAAVPIPLATRPELDECIRIEYPHPRIEQARLIMAWPTVSVHNWQEACGLELVASILGDGRNSRLVQRLREQRGWVRGIGCSSMVHQDPGLFHISAMLDTTYLEVVEEAIRDELRILREQLVTIADIERIRRLLMNDFIFSTEAPSQLASLFGYYDTIANWSGHTGSGMDLALGYLEWVHRITPETIQSIVQKYLSADKYILTILKPQATSLPQQRELVFN